jgi:hypothetical protein
LKPCQHVFKARSPLDPYQVLSRTSLKTLFKPNENIITTILKPIGGNKQMIRANRQTIGANKQMLGANKQIVGTNKRFGCFSLRQFVGANKQFVGANRQVIGRQSDGQPDRSLDRLVD